MGKLKKTITYVRTIHSKNVNKLCAFPSKWFHRVENTVSLRFLIILQTLVGLSLTLVSYSAIFYKLSKKIQ